LILALVALVKERNRLMPMLSIALIICVALHRRRQNGYLGGASAFLFAQGKISGNREQNARGSGRLGTEANLRGRKLASVV
jgi:hypothetical protein